MENIWINKIYDGREKMQLQSGELDDTYSLPSDRIKKDAIVWTCSTYGKMSSYYEAMI